jgi:hypothetical protein
MEQDRPDPRTPDQEADADRDASEVVEGPVGDAHLVDPTDAEELSADLEALPAIDDTESSSDSPRDSEPGV